MFAIIMLSISVSVDAFAAGISYGLRSIKIPLRSKSIICFFSIFYSAIAVLTGNFITRALSPEISNTLGIIILMLIGIQIIIKSFRKPKSKRKNQKKSCTHKTIVSVCIKFLGITIKIIKNPSEVDIDKSGTIDLAEAFLLCIALSIDGIAVSLGSVLSGLNPILIPVFIGLFQFVFLCFGINLGKKFADLQILNKYILSLTPGIIIIILAITRFF